MKSHTAEVILLGDSNIPSELLTPSMGSSFLLEGYEDMMYGAGVLDAGRGLASPAESGFVAVPSGLSKGASEYMNLEGMTHEASQLVDHSWLSEAFQDIERLPENPVDKSIPELEELWGSHRRTDGVHFKDLSYEKAASEEEPSFIYNERDLLQVVSSAMRRSAMGHPLKDILVQAGGELGEEAFRIREAMQHLKDEHGLAGNVFLRLAAYPGWENGKWASHVKRYAAGARYLVAPESVIHSATWIHNEHCTLTGKKVVASVPWEEAYQHYSPLLALSGRKVASRGDKKEALRAAFLSSPSKASIADNLPRHLNPADQVSLKEAREALTKVGPRQVLTPEAKKEALVRGALNKKLASLSAQGLLSPSDRDRLSSSPEAPVTILKQAAQLAGMPVSALYEGASFTGFSGNQTVQNYASAEEAWKNRRASEQQERVHLSVQKVKRAYQSGIRGDSLKAVILRTVLPEDVKIASSLLDPFLRETRALEETDHKRVYAGTQMTQHVAQKQASEVSPSMITAASRWVRRAMNEGAAGNELDELIQNRFPENLLRAASPEIGKIRQEHEGAAGFVYVEASAYATEGVKGCEEGALKHRANGVKTVLAMSQCGSCVHARQMMDGTTRCALYNKDLVSPSDFGEGLAGLKKANIASSNMTDQERTASLFAPAYNPDEFSLHNASLDSFDYLPLPENEKAGSVFFGGLLLGNME